MEANVTLFLSIYNQFNLFVKNIFSEKTKRKQRNENALCLYFIVNTGNDYKVATNNNSSVGVHYEEHRI
ncbi:hypothetical protein ACH3XW_30385 [Acanthocheilonema viteae]